MNKKNLPKAISKDMWTWLNFIYIKWRKSFIKAYVIIFFLIIIVVILSLLFNNNYSKDNQAKIHPENQFQNPYKIVIFLKKIYPDKNFRIAWIKNSSNPKLIHSLDLEYSDNLLGKPKKYINSQQTGEWDIMSKALCENIKFRNEFHYNLIHFKVVTSFLGIEVSRQNYFECDN